MTVNFLVGFIHSNWKLKKEWLRTPKGIGLNGSSILSNHRSMLIVCWHGTWHCIVNVDTVWGYDGDRVYLNWYTKKRSFFHYSSFYSCQSQGVGRQKRGKRRRSTNRYLDQHQRFYSHNSSFDFIYQKLEWDKSLKRDEKSRRSLSETWALHVPTKDISISLYLYSFQFQLCYPNSNPQ